MRHVPFKSGLILLAFAASPALAVDTVFYNNDFPDGKIATASRPEGNGKFEIETGDDFILSKPSVLTSGSFTGLIPKGTSVNKVVVEIYRVFPLDSTNPPSGAVPTRVNSPSDVAFESRETGDGLSVTASLLNNGIGVANSVIDGIHPIPDFRTGGEGGKSGQEVRFNFAFTDPITLPADHYFFVPQVLLSTGDFLWLSADRPIGSFGSTPINPDLQAWIRNEGLQPNWLRIGTDIIGPDQDPATYNMAFRLVGTIVPEPTAIAMLIAGLIAVATWSQRKRT